MLLTIFFLLIIKHFICDFALQGRLKGPYDKYLLTSRKGHLHALDHAIATALIFLFASSWAIVQGKAIFVTVILFGILDYVLHFIIDWLKNNFVVANNMNKSQRQFWILSCVDQCLHTTCYLVYVVLFDIYFF